MSVGRFSGFIFEASAGGRDEKNVLIMFVVLNTAELSIFGFRTNMLEATDKTSWYENKNRISYLKVHYRVR